MLILLLSVVLLAFAQELNLVKGTFSYSNCGSPSTSVKALTISPDPIVLGKEINVQTLVKVGSLIGNATFATAALTIETKTLGVWVPIPCVGGVGSCTYTGQDLCGRLQEHADQNCPKLKPHGLPCVCPFLPGTYQTPAGGLVIETKNPGISWLTSGDYYIKALLTANDRSTFVCLEVYFSLGS